MSRAALKKASGLTPADVVLHLGRRLEVRSVEPTHKDGLRVRVRGHEPIQVRWDAELWVEAVDVEERLRAEVAFLRHGSTCDAKPYSCGVTDDGVELVSGCAVGSELLRQLEDLGGPVQ